MKPEELLHKYRIVTRNRRWMLSILSVLTIAALALDLMTGPAAIAPLTVLQGLLDPSALELGDRIILWDVRLPDTLMALAVGAALGLAGTEIQTILNNPLGSPFTLGLSSAATFGAAAAIALSLDVQIFGYPLSVPAFAFVFALASGFTVLALSNVLGGSASSIVLFGIALLFFCDAATAVLQFVSSDEAVRQIVFWRLGDLTKAGWTELTIVSATLLVILPFAYRSSASLTMLKGGEELAAGAGLKLAAIRRSSILRISLLTAMSVAFVGAISFVGLVGPHIARMVLGEDHRFLIPGAALTGALLLSLASFASKVAIPGIIVPVGIATSLVGIPFFVTLIFLQRRRQL